MAGSETGASSRRGSMRETGAGLTRRDFIGAGVAASLALAVGGASQRASAAGPLPAGLIPAQARIGLVGSLFRDVPEWAVMMALAPFKKYLEAQMGTTSKLENAGDPLDLGKRMAARDLHLGVFHGFEFAWAQQRFPDLKPLFIAVNEEPVVAAHL